MKNTQRKTSKSYITLKQRITAAVTAVVMLAQIFIPTIALATTAWSGNFESRIANELNSPMIELINDPAAPETYKGAYFIHKSTINHTTLDSFYSEYKGGKPAQKPKFIGDSFVQTRLIRAQYRALMGRYFFSGVLRVEEVEAEAITNLYSAAKNYAEGSNLTLGTPLGNTSSAPDMIWPELRQINGKSYLVPVVHLSDVTVSTRSTDHLILFNSNAEFAGIQLDFATLVTGYNSTIVGLGGIINNSGTIKSPGNVTLATNGTFANMGGTITAAENIKIFSKDFYNKTLVVPYKDKNGEGTRLGRVGNVDAVKGDLYIHARNDITFEGANGSAGETLKLQANNNINILPQQTSGSSQSQEGDWEVNKNTTNLLMSRLAAEDTLSLIAGGVINITASELISSRGGIELLAKQGIYVWDCPTEELTNPQAPVPCNNTTQISKVDRKGKTTGQSSEFRTEAVRAILKAGKGVLLDSEFGDVVLKATNITSTEGTKVEAKNGTVHLLMTKELEEFHLQTVRKGTWKIKTRTEDVIHENNIQNAIVGGLQVQAKYGVNVEYTGKEGATLKEQLEEYAKMPEMAWMAKLYNKCWVEKEGEGITAGSISATDPNNFTHCDGPKVNWSQVEEVHEEIRKSKSTLSPAAMAIIAIAVCIAMGPAGANLIGAGGIGGATVTSTSIAGVTTVTTSVSLSGAIAQAAMLTLATQAAQSLASGNNLRETISTFDSDENLRSLAISMATAGAMNYAKVGKFELFEVPDGTEYSFASFGNQAYTAVAGATINSAVSVSINGGNSEAYKEAFKRALVTNAINTIGQNLANKIATAPSLDGAMQYISNAALGCLTEGLTVKLTQQDSKDACASGAGGAVISVGLADILEQKTKSLIQTTVTEGRVNQSAAELSSTLSFLNKHQVDISRLLAGLIAFAAHGDVNAASNSASVIGAAQQQRIMRTVAVSQTILAMGMANCGDASLGDCAKKAAVNEFRKGLVELGKYSAQEIDAKINYLKTQTTFFDDLGAYNAALLETNGSLEELTQASKSYPDPNSSPSDGSVHVGEGGVKVLPKVVVTAERWSVMRESLFDLGETIGLVTNAADTLVQDGVKALLETPYGAPLRWGFAKVAEAAKEYPEVAALLNKPEELKEALGTGTTAKLLGDKYTETKSYINSNPVDDLEWHESVSNAASGFSWVVGVLGAGALGYVAKAMTFTRVTSDGRNFSNDEKDFYENEIAKEFTGITRNHLRNQLLTHNIKLKAGWDADRLYDEVLSKPKGQRPPPSDYLSAEYISAHLSKFEGGVVKIKATAREGMEGPPGGTFVMSKEQARQLIKDANGDVGKLEISLGLNPGDLGDSPVVLDISMPQNMRLPSGNEMGANKYWIPGGKTSGQVIEVTIDPIPAANYTVHPLSSWSLE
jgi:filamentous hemagglutinin